MLKRLWRTIANNVIAPSELSFANVRVLLSPGGRSDEVKRHISAVIVARVQLVSALFAVLVPLFSVIDVLVFDRQTAFFMFGLRLIACCLFVALAWPREASPTAPYRQAVCLLFGLLMIPPLFHLASVDVLQSAADSEGQRLLAKLYGYLPTIVLGGLAIFPLTALEALLMAIPVIGAALASLAIEGVSFNVVEQGGQLWFMSMLLGVAMFSGMSQCHYMASLVYRATHDPLTGAYTRRSGEDALNLLFRLGDMSGKPLTVAFIDLDRFKSINDQFGHEAGDDALRTLVERLREGLRRNDFLIRWGGEEFVAVLPDTPAENLPMMFQRLRSLGLGMRPDGAPLTASIGVASTHEAGVNCWGTLISRADQRMYVAKQSGRDCIVLGDGVPRPVCPVPVAA